MSALELGCGGRESNPHGPYGPADFKFDLQPATFYTNVTYGQSSSSLSPPPPRVRNHSRPMVHGGSGKVQAKSALPGGRGLQGSGFRLWHNSERLCNPLRRCQCATHKGPRGDLARTVPVVAHACC